MADHAGTKAATIHVARRCRQENNDTHTRARAHAQRTSQTNHRCQRTLKGSRMD